MRRWGRGRDIREAVNVGDPVQMAITFAYVGVLIANPPVIGGRTLAPTPGEANIAFTFTQPVQPCDGPRCEQEIFRIEKNPNSCWVYDNIFLDNVNDVPGFKFLPAIGSEMLRLRSLGNVNGLTFVFRAHVSSLCAPTS
jgi:hypothetical protein